MKFNYMQKTTTSRFPRLSIDTDRAAMLVILAAPGILAIIAFVIAVSLTGFGLPTVGTLRSKVAALSYLYLTACVLWLPAYTIAYGWFWWRTRDEAPIFNRLWLLPLVEGLFVWFPSIVFSGVPRTQLWQTLVPFVLTAVFAGYAWVGIARLIFYAWRRK